jgi:hypothetical protein
LARTCSIRSQFLFAPPLLGNVVQREDEAFDVAAVVEQRDTGGREHYL